jgi:hypothetical protein
MPHEIENELALRAPRAAYWLGIASHHPDIHRDHSEEHEQENITSHGPSIYPNNTAIY